MMGSKLEDMVMVQVIPAHMTPGVLPIRKGRVDGTHRATTPRKFHPDQPL